MNTYAKIDIAPRKPLDQYIREIDKTPLLSPRDEKSLAIQIDGGDPKARDHMIRANLRLVVKNASDLGLEV